MEGFHESSHFPKEGRMSTHSGDSSEHKSSARPPNSASPPAPKDKLSPLQDETAKEFVSIFKLLADETRLRILHYLLQEKEINVRTFCQLLGQTQPAVSHHLALLRMAGLIECRRDGKHNFYHLVPQRIQSILDLVFGSSETSVRKIQLANCILTCQSAEQLGA